MPNCCLPGNCEPATAASRDKSHGMIMSAKLPTLYEQEWATIAGNNLESFAARRDSAIRAITTANLTLPKSRETLKQPTCRRFRAPTTETPSHSVAVTPLDAKSGQISSKNRKTYARCGTYRSLRYERGIADREPDHSSGEERAGRPNACHSVRSAIGFGVSGRSKPRSERKMNLSFLTTIDSRFVPGTNPDRMSIG